jgi:multiple sugar transport system ATP-binding protein
MADVALERLAKTYANGVHALRDVTLSARDGELLVLVGPSGCGKTTLLRIIAGLETPTAGVVRLGSRVVNREPPYRRDVAMVFQRPALYPHLTVRDNLSFGLDQRRPWSERVRHWFRRNGTADERGERVREAAELLELTDVLQRRPAELSGGQQQRVALGRALVRRPAVFLLDEPLSNLDARLRLEMRRQLHLLHRRLRATMVYVTHDQDEATALGDRVAVLDRGALQQIDRPDILYQRPINRFVAGFLGWPPMNLLDGELVEAGGQLCLVGPAACLTLAGPRRAEWHHLAGRAVTLGIRPEQLRVGPANDGETRLSLEVRLVEKAGPNCLVTGVCVESGTRQTDQVFRPERRLTPRPETVAATFAARPRDGWTVTVRLERQTAPPEGAAVEVGFDLGRAHLFDRESGVVLAHGRGDA